ncbi:hypothetical protein DB345_07005 [Spartobacteria bacterium LR76]|nr:hypothetical protein DB345_07005 [Spartobacteria bacterium LR76]
MSGAVISTARFDLKPLSVANVTERYAGWLLDPASQQYIVAASRSSLEQLRDYVAERSGRDDVLFLGIFIRETGEHIGNLKYEPIDYSKQIAVCGILVGEVQWRGKGVAGEVISAGNQWLAKDRKISRILLGVSPDNLAARRAYEKIGFLPYDNDANGNLKMVLDLDPARRLAIGTVQFGMDYGVKRARKSDIEEVRDILREAFSLGIDTLDTAAAYGESEAVLGAIAADDWKVVSKIGAVPDDCLNIEEWMDHQVKASLDRLRIPSLYGLLLHVPGQLLGPRGPQIYRALTRVKELGLAKKIGISIYSPSELDEIFRCYALDLVQAPFNIIDRRLIESGWMKKLVESDVELHVRSVFLQGLLLMSSADRPAKFGRWASLWSAWDEWLYQTKLTPLAACLRYVLSFPEISRVVVGMESLRQFQEIYASARGQAFTVPSELQAKDLDLLNPYKWSAL